MPSSVPRFPDHDRHGKTTSSSPLTSPSPEQQQPAVPVSCDGRVVITEPDVAVTLPVLKYGYRTSKASWSELVQIINVERDIPKMSRSRHQQHEYEVFKHHMKKQYQSGNDFILISKFGFDSVRDHQDGRWKATPQLNDVRESRTVLSLNDFPYFVDDDAVVHYVLWKIKDTISEQEIVDAETELRTNLHAVDILHWINPRNLQSIPEIDHVHYLCLVAAAIPGMIIKSC